MCKWIRVEDELPEIKEWGDSALVMVTVQQLEWDEEDSKQYGIHDPEYFTEAAWLKKLSNGTLIWTKEYSEAPIEEYDHKVIAWAPYPQPMEV